LEKVRGDIVKSIVRIRDWWLGQLRAQRGLGRLVWVAAPLLFGCCFCSLALMSVATLRNPEPTAVVAEPGVVVVVTAVGASPTREQPTDLPVRDPATATSRPTDPPTPRPSVTAARPKATAVPSATPWLRRTSVPSATPIPPTATRPLATATVAPTVTRPPATAAPPTVVPPTAAPPTAVPTAGLSGQETGVVTNIVDGDTIDVSIGGTVYRVRYIGINTPESNEMCGSEATAANAALVSGQTVRMVRDVSQTDQYDRLLRYVYVGDTFVNGALVAGGWAAAVDYPPDTAMSGTLHDLMAQAAGRGCALVAAPTATAVPDRGGAPVGNCDPSYPTVCIPPPPPDLDCGDIPYRRFQVLPPDPHNFDREGDGLGCEG